VVVHPGADHVALGRGLAAVAAGFRPDGIE
jgi:hypothetical protein